jgi:hypothetical protein
MGAAEPPGGSAPDLAGTPLEKLDFPMIETQDEFVLQGFRYPNYLAVLGPNAQAEIFQQVLDRPRDAGCVPQDARVPDDGEGAERGRSDLADVGRGRFRHYAGGRRQLGRSRDHTQEHLLRHGAGCRVGRPASWTR